MKKQITKILLGTALLISGQAMSQQTDLTEKNPFLVESVYHGEVTSLFKVKIYPNPSYISTVKMEWVDWAEVDRIQMNNITTNQVKVLDVAKGVKKIMVSGLSEGTYTVTFSNQNEILGTRKIKVID
jgi:hypothetical protein